MPRARKKALNRTGLPDIGKIDHVEGIVKKRVAFSSPFPYPRRPTSLDAAVATVFFSLSTYSFSTFVTKRQELRTVNHGAKHNCNVHKQDDTESPDQHGG